MAKIVKLANGCKQSTCGKCGKKIIVSAPFELRNKVNGSAWGDGKHYCKSCSTKKNAEALKKKVDSGVKATLEKVKKVYVCPICLKYSNKDTLQIFKTKDELKKHLVSSHGNFQEVDYMLRYGGRTRGLR